MTASQEYRQYAGECLRWARKIKDEAQQQLFLEMASAWMQAAALEDGELPTAPKADPSLAPRHSAAQR
jgi:hypothetical protein